MRISSDLCWDAEFALDPYLFDSFTPRWTAYDRVKFKLDLPPEIPLKTQERAYTSPIWYAPKG